eukprot:sb/3473706/
MPSSSTKIFQVHGEFFMSTVRMPANQGVFDEMFWKTSRDFRRYWKEGICLSDKEMTLPLGEMLSRYFGRLLSESTIKSCHAADWIVVPNLLTWSLGVSNEGEYFYPMAKSGVLMLALLTVGIIVRNPVSSIKLCATLRGSHFLKTCH